MENLPTGKLVSDSVKLSSGCVITLRDKSHLTRRVSLLPLNQLASTRSKPDQTKNFIDLTETDDDDDDVDDRGRTKQEPDADLSYDVLRTKQEPYADLSYDERRTKQEPDADLLFDERRTKQEPDADLPFDELRTKQEHDANLSFDELRTKQEPDTDLSYDELSLQERLNMASLAGGIAGNNYADVTTSDVGTEAEVDPTAAADDDSDMDDFFVELDADDIAVDSGSAPEPVTASDSTSPDGNDGNRDGDDSLSDYVECNAVVLNSNDGMPGLGATKLSRSSGKDHNVADEDSCSDYMECSTVPVDDSPLIPTTYQEQFRHRPEPLSLKVHVIDPQLTEKDENFTCVESPLSATSQLFIADDLYDDEQSDTSAADGVSSAENLPLSAVKQSLQDNVLKFPTENVKKSAKPEEIKSGFACRQYQPFVKLVRLSVEALKKYCSTNKDDKFIAAGSSTVVSASLPVKVHQESVVAVKRDTVELAQKSLESSTSSQLQTKKQQNIAAKRDGSHLESGKVSGAPPTKKPSGLTTGTTSISEPSRPTKPLMSVPKHVSDTGGDLQKKPMALKAANKMKMLQQALAQFKKPAQEQQIKEVEKELNSQETPQQTLETEEVVMQETLLEQKLEAKNVVNVERSRETKNVFIQETLSQKNRVETKKVVAQEMQAAKLNMFTIPKVKAGLPSAAAENRPAPVPPAPDEEFIVRVTGLPPVADKNVVLRLFEDWSRDDSAVTDVHFTRGADGKPDGKAYVELSSEVDMALVLAKYPPCNRATSVRVAKASSREMNWVLKHSGLGHPSPQSSNIGRYFVRLRGLPNDCTNEDIKRFLQGCQIKDMQHVMTDCGLWAGEAYVELEKDCDYRLALSKNKQYIGSRYIEVFNASYVEVGEIYRTYRDPPDVTKHIAWLRGLPSYCPETVIFQFLEGCSILSIHYLQNNRQTQAFVELSSLEDLQMALSKDSRYIERCCVNVLKSSYNQMQLALHSNKQQTSSNPSRLDEAGDAGAALGSFRFGWHNRSQGTGRNFSSSTAPVYPKGTVVPAAALSSVLSSDPVWTGSEDAHSKSSGSFPPVTKPSRFSTTAGPAYCPATVTASPLPNTASGDVLSSGTATVGREAHLAGLYDKDAGSSASIPVRMSWTVEPTLQTKQLEPANVAQQSLVPIPSIPLSKSLTESDWDSLCGIYVGKFDCKSVTKLSIQTAFEVFGPITSLTYNDTRSPQGHAIIVYVSPDAALLAIRQMNKMPLGDSTPSVCFKTRTKNPTASEVYTGLAAELTSSRRVYVASLQNDVMDCDLQGVFETVGKVTSCQLAVNNLNPAKNMSKLRDLASNHDYRKMTMMMAMAPPSPSASSPSPSPSSSFFYNRGWTFPTLRGYAYIEYETVEMANDAIAMLNYFNFRGQNLRVGKAITPPAFLRGSLSSNWSPAIQAAWRAAAIVSAKCINNDKTKAESIEAARKAAMSIAAKLVESSKSSAPVPTASTKSDVRSPDVRRLMEMDFDSRFEAVSQKTAAEASNSKIHEKQDFSHSKDASAAAGATGGGGGGGKNSRTSIYADALKTIEGLTVKIADMNKSSKVLSPSHPVNSKPVPSLLPPTKPVLTVLPSAKPVEPSTSPSSHRLLAPPRASSPPRSHTHTISDSRECEVVDVHFVSTPLGTERDVYVELGSDADLKTALSRHQACFDGRPVKVFKSTQHELKLVARCSPKSVYIVCIQNLPTYFTRCQLVEFLASGNDGRANNDTDLRMNDSREARPSDIDRRPAVPVCDRTGHAAAPPGGARAGEFRDVDYRSSEHGSEDKLRQLLESSWKQKPSYNGPPMSFQSSPQLSSAATSDRDDRLIPSYCDTDRRAMTYPRSMENEAAARPSAHAEPSVLSNARNSLQKIFSWLRDRSLAEEDSSESPSLPTAVVDRPSPSSAAATADILHSPRDCYRPPTEQLPPRLVSNEMRDMRLTSDTTLGPARNPSWMADDSRPVSMAPAAWSSFLGNTALLPPSVVSGRSNRRVVEIVDRDERIISPRTSYGTEADPQSHESFRDVDSRRRHEDVDLRRAGPSWKR